VEHRRWVNKEHAIEKSVAGSKWNLARTSKAASKPVNGTTSGSSARECTSAANLDEQLIADCRIVPFGLCGDCRQGGETGEIIVKVVNGAEVARTVALNRRDRGVASSGEAITLTSPIWTTRIP